MRKCNWDPSVLENGCVKDFLLCGVFEGEVNNGGIFQFLSNSSGDMAEDTACALEKIDTPASVIMREIIQCFPGKHVPTDQKNRNDVMDQLDEETLQRLNKLDQATWSIDILKNSYDFLMAHKNEFLCF